MPEAATPQTHSIQHQHQQRICEQNAYCMTGKCLLVAGVVSILLSSYVWNIKSACENSQLKKDAARTDREDRKCPNFVCSTICGTLK